MVFLKYYVFLHKFKFWGNMFNSETYINRRQTLKETVKSGLILFPGNTDAPANGPYNYYHFRQDSSFLYYFGLQREDLFGIIDVDNDCDYLFGDDVDIDDIIWFGSVQTVSEQGEQVGITHTGRFQEARVLIEQALAEGKSIHFLPPYRYSTKQLLAEWLQLEVKALQERASLELIHAVVAQRSIKSDAEVNEIERACAIGYKMHTMAMKLCSPAVTEHFIAGMLDGVANSLGAMVSFPSIVTMHGEIMHGYPSDNYLEDGRLLLVDAGAETIDNYCSDHTRTSPISGHFTNKQRDIYTIVEECHDLAKELAKPQVFWKDVHMAVCRKMTEMLKDLGLMKGDVDAAVAAGAHALFLPHGLGHMMGMDVHDMESIGQKYVGFDSEVQPSEQFGLASLRLGRRLQEGFVVTDEPGIYFIPALIDLWESQGTNKDFLNFDNINKFRNFGGIRIEDDLLITADGARFLGKDQIPYHIPELEEYLLKNKYE